MGLPPNLNFNYVLTMTPKTYSKQDKSGFFRRASSDLLANFRRSLGNIPVDSQQALGLHDDLLDEFR